jgi:hypothetical protein
MTYALVILQTDALWETLSDAEKEFDALVQWWTDLRERGVIVDGVQLAPSRTAQTVGWENRRPIVTDGPHIEAKETVGGLAILNVGSQEEAVEIAKTWPSQRAIRLEVRAILPRRIQ